MEFPDQDPARLSSRLDCRQPRRGPAARRRRHPQVGQRQCRRHQRAAHARRGRSRSGSSSSTSPRAGSRRRCCPRSCCRRFPRHPSAQAAWLPAACAFAAILGHVFPVWHGFRGGKGVATLVGAFAGLDLGLLVPLFASWLAVVVVAGLRRAGVDRRLARHPDLSTVARRRRFSTPSWGLRWPAQRSSSTRTAATCGACAPAPSRVPADCGCSAAARR